MAVCWTLLAGWGATCVICCGWDGVGASSGALAGALPVVGGLDSVARGKPDSDDFRFGTLVSPDGSGDICGGGGSGGGCCIGGGGRAGGGHLAEAGGEEPLPRSSLRFKESPADLTYEPERSKRGLPSTDGDLESRPIVGGEGRGRGGLGVGFVSTRLPAIAAVPDSLCIFRGWKHFRQVSGRNRCGVNLLQA